MVTIGQTVNKYSDANTGEETMGPYYILTVHVVDEGILQHAADVKR